MLLLALFASANAYAHINAGTYKGVDQKGQPCEMTVGRTYFEGGAHHPLNERIEVQTQGENYLVVHPSAADFTASKISFNHDFFEAINATPTGATALQIKMSHTKKFAGPVEFVRVSNNWIEKTQSQLVCSGIVLK